MSTAKQIRQLLIKGIKAVQDGRPAQAELSLQKVLDLNAGLREKCEAWYWLSRVSADVDRQERYLAQVLAEMPEHERAQRALAKLKRVSEEDEAEEGEPLPDVTTTAVPQQRPSHCPNCDRQLFFSPDGQSLICEICDYSYQLPIEVTIDFMELDKNFHEGRLERIRHVPPPNAPATYAAQRRVSLLEVGQASNLTREPHQAKSSFGKYHESLRRGIEYAREGEADIAYNLLAQVLESSESTDKECLEAWLWMSEIQEKPDFKRKSLENALSLDMTDPRARKKLAILDGRLDPDQMIDPAQADQIVAEAGTVTAETTQMRCPQCDARMNFSPEEQALRCEFCGYLQDIDQQPAAPQPGQFQDREQDFIAALHTAQGHAQPIQQRVLQCERCAIEFILSPETLSVTCPYCDSVYVAEAAETQEIIPPHGLIPFTTDEGMAEKALRRWFKKHKIDGPRVTDLVGTYFPVWTFDANIELVWRCEVKEQQLWAHRQGQDFIIYDDLLLPAVPHKLPGDLVDHLDTFDLNQLVDYDARYLADWAAERYQIPISEASLLIRKKIMRQVRRQRGPERYVMSYTHRNFSLGSRGLTIESYKLVLLPIWLTHYTYEGESYDLLINGQNGEVGGQRPEGLLDKIFSFLHLSI